MLLRSPPVFSETQQTPQFLLPLFWNAQGGSRDSPGTVPMSYLFSHHALGSTPDQPEWVWFVG